MAKSSNISNTAPIKSNAQQKNALSKPKEKVTEKVKAVKVKDIEETGENLASIVETSQNTFKSKFETLYQDITKALPKHFKAVVPMEFSLDSTSIPYFLTLEIPSYSEKVYWVERMIVRVTWNMTASGNPSKSLPIKFTLI